MRLLSVIVCLLFSASLAAQEAWPSKPIRMILPFPPGGGTDILGRLIADRLAASLGQPVVTENRGGAGGNVGAEAAARSAPDGYTIVLVAPSLAISPTLYSKLNYDPVKDLAPISLVATVPNVMVTQPSMPGELKEFIAAVKAKPGAFNFGSGGAGTSNHLAAELLKSVTGAPMTHVPYRGSGPGMIDVISGHVTCMFDILVTALPQIRAGKVRALAVASAKRSPFAPDIPTMAESGVDGYAQAGNEPWFGIFAPAGTPAAIVDRLNGEFRKALGSPELSQVMKTQGYDVWTLDPAAFLAFIRDDHAKWGKVVKDAGLKPE